MEKAFKVFKENAFRGQYINMQHFAIILETLMLERQIFL